MPWTLTWALFLAATQLGTSSHLLEPHDSRPPQGTSAGWEGKSTVRGAVALHLGHRSELAVVLF